MLTQSLFVVPSGQVAVVTTLGKVSGGSRRPGLNFKIPFVQSVFPFEYITEFADPPDREVEPVNGWRYPKVFQLLSESAKTKKPFCLFLSSNEPHGPYTKGDPAPYQNAKLTPQQIEIHRESYAKYLAEITYFDGQVGEVLRMVEQLNLRSNTLIFVATEQGSTFPFGKFTC